MSIYFSLYFLVKLSRIQVSLHLVEGAERLIEVGRLAIDNSREVVAKTGVVTKLLNNLAL